MSGNEKLIEWLRNMGYDGKIPESLSKMCIPSTSFIWEQIISKVISRQEVAHIRKNIIINRLKQKALDTKHEFSYPIKEIQTYLERQESSKKVSILEDTLKEKKAMIDERLRKNKSTYVALNHIKQKIKENKETKYLLDRKSKMFENDINEAEKVLTLARNLTPVEMEENSNGAEITETLQKCAEKLEKLAKGATFSSKRFETNPNRSVFAASTLKTTNISEFIDSSSLLTSTACHNEETVLSGVNFLNEPRELVTDKRTSKPSNKRESLGLLPDSFIDFDDDFDDIFLTDRSITFSNITKKPDCDIFDKLTDNREVKELLKKLLYKHNRQMIMKSCENIFEELTGELRNLTLECIKKKNSLTVDQNDLSELYFLHVKNELKKDKYTVILKKLRENIKKRKQEIYCSLTTSSRNENINVFELQVENAGLIVTKNFLGKKIKFLNQTSSGNELQVTNKQITEIKDEIVHEFESVQGLVNNIYKILDDIKHNREETSSFVRSLGSYILDLSWANPLQEKHHSEEITTFQNFPLEFNRNLGSTLTSTVPSYVDLDSKNLKMISELLNTPFSPSENILINSLRSKIKLNVLEHFKTEFDEDIDYHKYDSEEFSRSAEHTEIIINKLKAITESSSVQEILSASNKMKEIADLWMEMPMKDSISEQRLVEGHNYKFYEKMFDNYNNNFCLHKAD